MKTATAFLSMIAAAVPGASSAENYEFQVEELKPQKTMAIRFEAAEEELAETYGQVFGELFTYVMSNGGQMAGRPYGRYLKFGEEKFEVEAGLPVAKVLPDKGRIKQSELPGGPVATTIHVGPYEELSAAHEALETWLEKNGKEADGGPWEVYLTDPSMESDPSKYKTQIFQPIKDAAKSQ